MSTLSIPRPKKLSDGQFIGDLTKLLERRKIKCGDPLSLESFGSELTSNNILRSDLFTLCTAISHMGEEDLSGEQLLVLVGRAVGGAKVCRGDGAVEIPDTMRSAFLSGFDAWGKRGSDVNEPLPWPPPRPQLAHSEPLPEADDFEARPETTASKAPASGLHSIQEALDIAKKRSPTGLAQPPRSAAAGTNVDGLTISELKTLLEDIEHRMSRIQPHLSQLNSVVDSTAGDSRPLKRASEFEEVIPFRAANAAADPTLPNAGRSQGVLASSLAAMVAAEAARRSAADEVNEDAFLARHPYLKPSRRVVPEVKFLPVVSVEDLAPGNTAAAPSQGTEAVSQPQIEPAIVAMPAPLLGVPVPPVAPIATSAGTGLSASPPLVPMVMLHGNDPGRASGVPPRAIEANLVFLPEGLSVSPRVVSAIGAVLLLVLIGFGGLFAYDSLHPRLIIRYSDPNPSVAAQSAELQASPTTGTAPAIAATASIAGGGSVRPAGSDPRALVRLQPPAVHTGTARATTQPTSANAKPQPQGYVWPPPPARMGADETPAPPPSLVPSAASTAPTPRLNPLTGPPPSAIYVPSSTMIKYALATPRPVYPADHAKGMEGTVVVQITISKQGDVTSARAISGPIEFRSAAVQAVRAWRFRPYLFSGSPADVETMLEVPSKPE